MAASPEITAGEAGALGTELALCKGKGEIQTNVLMGSEGFYADSRGNVNVVCICSAQFSESGALPTDVGSRPGESGGGHSPALRRRRIVFSSLHPRL
jgi:hypothetical protein